ncbi:MAG: small basic protein [Planctomycetota bacterium]|nr:MAG: small basic protein [Planctomycetota bacterium]
MSIHKSLFIGGSLTQERSVFTRRERLERLAKEGQWEEGDSPFGIPKVRTKFKVLTRRQLKAQAAAAQTEGEGSEAAAEEAEGES